MKATSDAGAPGSADGGAPAVSVVIPTRNREHLIAEAALNALDQRGVDAEVVVVDDASTDGTAGVLEALGEPRLRIVRRRDQGRLAAARNSGIEAARGEWIAFLDDDDVWSPDKLALQLAAAEAAGAGFAYGGAITVDESLVPLHLWRLPPPDDLLRELLALNVMPAGASNVLVRADLVRELGGFDVDLSHTTDWDMWIRLAAASAGAAVPDVVVAYRLHQQQESDRGREMLAELELIDAKHRDLRTELGVELDRATFADYTRKRGKDPADSAPEGDETRRPVAGSAARISRRLRRALGREEGNAVATPEWLRIRSAGVSRDA